MITNHTSLCDHHVSYKATPSALYSHPLWSHPQLHLSAGMRCTAYQGGGSSPPVLPCLLVPTP